MSPKYVDIANNLENHSFNLEKDYEKRTKILSKKKPYEWHKEMDRVVNKMKDKLIAFKMKQKCHSWGHLIGIKETERSIKISF